ncbi:rod-binding protein [Bosea sp. LjRoot9]|uniref:rod-binding protein n=1 Tax=Bosea sp. LjRoot9 TaxID=3342341 RepID=UPI003ECEBDF1
MAISPPSDIVLDVALAADPQRQRAAFDRLARMAVPGAATTQFASAIEGAGAALQAPGLASARDKFASLTLTKPSFAKPSFAKPSAAAAGDQSATAKTLRQFEAQVISTFIEQMMPEATTNTFGSGLSGGVWRSMLSEQIAGEIAKTGGLGIRSKVMAALAARSGNTAGAEPGTVVATTQKALAPTASAGASSRDLAIPLAVERKLLNITRPSAIGVGRTSTTRQV